MILAQAVAEATAHAQPAGNGITFTGGQVIAIGAGLLGGVSTLFGLLMRSMDGRLKESQEHNRTLSQQAAEAREKENAVTNRLIDQLGGAIKTSEMAIRESTTAMNQLSTAVTRQIEITTTDHQEVSERNTREHQEMLRVLERLTERLAIRDSRDSRDGPRKAVA